MIEGNEQARPRVWALYTLLPVLLASSLVAAYLGWVHIVLTHGAGAFESACNLGGSFDCDKVNTSRWSELFGLPVSLWAMPLYAATAWLAWVARGGGRRAWRAQGAVVLVASWNVLVSAFLAYVSLFVLQYVCLFCVALYALHALALVLVLLPAGGRKPAIPAPVDLGICMGVALVALVLLFPLNMFLTSSLDEAVVVELEQSAASPTEARRDSGSVRLPDKFVDIAPFTHSPARGPADAPVTVVVV